MPRALRNCHRNRGARATSSEVGYNDLPDRLREISDWMSASEAAEAADVTQRTIYHWVREGLLKVELTSSPWRVKHE